MKAAAISAKQVRGTFDRYTDEFDRWFTRNRALYVSELKALEAAGPAGLVLDVGVGSGAFASKLKVAVGVDTSRELLKISKRRGLEVILADAGALPFRTRAFDTVVSSFTVCFVESVKSLLLESWRVLREDGRFVLGEITLDSRWGSLYSREGRKGHRFYGKARFLTFGRTRTLLRMAGFDIIKLLGTIDFGPQDVPRVQSPVELSIRRTEDVGRYGFICILAQKTSVRA